MTDKELISELRSIADKRRKGNRFDSLEYAAADRIEKLVQERDAMLRVVTDNHVALQRAEAAEAEERAEAARAEARHGFKSSMSAAELASVEAKITAAFDELICRHPKLSDELRDSCLLLILEVR